MRHATGELPIACISGFWVILRIKRLLALRNREERQSRRRSAFGDQASTHLNNIFLVNPLYSHKIRAFAADCPYNRVLYQPRLNGLTPP